jgi:type III secretory pathway component EscS
MGNPGFDTILLQTMFSVILLAGVPLAIATFIGLTIAIFQAVTSIQDQTLGQTAKIAVISIILMAFGAALSAPLMQITHDIFNNFAFWTR